MRRLTIPRSGRMVFGVVLSDIVMGSKSKERGTIDRLHYAIDYAVDWVSWGNPVDDLTDLCSAMERQHRGGRRMRQSVDTAARYFVVKTICAALDEGYHKRKTCPVSALDDRADFVKARAIVHQFPWLSLVLPPRVRAVVRVWDYVEIIAG